MNARRAGWALAAVASSAIASSGCFTYYIGSKSFDHEPSGRTEAILLSSEVVAGAGAGAILYVVSDPDKRLPLAASAAIGVGLTFLIDLAVGGVVALTGCLGNEACDR
jgi:hypothetical protein